MIAARADRVSGLGLLPVASFIATARMGDWRGQYQR
jgi:hypothetical protein